MKARKIGALLLSICMMMVSVVPVMAAEATFEDMPANWSTEALQKAVDNGLISGFSENGKTYIKANNPLSRAQMAAIINNAFNTAAKASLQGTTDVRSTDWFADHMAMAIQMNSFARANKMRPNDNITREEAFTVLAKVFMLPEAIDLKSLNAFSDSAQVSDYAKGRIAALLDAQYISGSNGRINPKANITRAEFAAVMNNIVKSYIVKSGEVTEVGKGNVLVNAPGVTLKDITIEGDLIAADGIGSGDITLDGVKVTGRLVVRGGGADSVKIIGDSDIQSIIAYNINNPVRIYAKSGIKIPVIDVAGQTKLEGEFNTVNVSGENAVIDILKGSKITNFNVKQKSIIRVAEGAVVDKMMVDSAADGSSLDNQGTVNDIGGNGTLSGGETTTPSTPADTTTGGAVGGGGGGGGGSTTNTAKSLTITVAGKAITGSTSSPATDTVTLPIGIRVENINIGFNSSKNFASSDTIVVKATKGKVVKQETISTALANTISFTSALSTLLGSKWADDVQTELDMGGSLIVEFIVNNSTIVKIDLLIQGSSN